MKRDDSICFTFKKMSHCVHRCIDHEMSEAGFDEVTIMHGWIMGFLHHAEGPVYQKDIESNFGIGRSTVTNILKLMEKKGYVTRTEDDKDARLKRIVLTPLGEKMHEETVKVIESTHDQMEKGITPEERKVFFEIMEKLRGNINKIMGQEDK